MSSEDLKPEVDIIMKINDNGKQVVLTFNSPDPFTVASFILELETYLHEISVASDQRNRTDAKGH